MLDPGVGAGRTTALLAHKVRSYVGVDYSAAMVKACQATFPDLRICCLDAQDLSSFAGESFDVVLFSYNSIDCLFPDAARHRCIREVRRVLAPRGRFLFSSHNARWCLPEIEWTWRPVDLLKRVYWGISTPRMKLRVRNIIRGARLFRRAYYLIDPLLNEASDVNVRGGVLCTMPVRDRSSRKCGGWASRSSKSAVRAARGSAGR